MQDPIALQYGVTQIPTTLVVDSKGIIVARDLYGDDLKEKIEELLAKK